MRSWLFGSSATPTASTPSNTAPATQASAGGARVLKRGHSSLNSWSSYDLVHVTGSRRQRALLELKTCVQGLLRALVPAPAISAQPLPTPPPPLTRSKSTQHLDSDRPVVELPWTGGGAEEGLGGQVVMAVEQAVFLGARRQEFKGVLPFMRMLHTIVHEHPWRVPVSAQLRASYENVRKSSECGTASGKARLWVRRALVGRELALLLAELTHKHAQVVECFYGSTSSLLLCPEGAELLLGLVESLHDCFNFTLPPPVVPTTPTSPSSRLGLDKQVLYPLLVEEDQGLPEPPLPPPLGPGLEAERLEPDDDSKFNMIRRQRPALSFNEHDDESGANDETLARLMKQVGVGLDRLVSFGASRARHLLYGAEQGNSGTGGGEGAGPEAKWGSRSLVQHVRDPLMCRHALLQPAIGVPQPIRELVEYLGVNVGPSGLAPPSLFADPDQCEGRGRRHVVTQLLAPPPSSPTHDQPDGNIEPDTPPEVAACALLWLLDSLPEPLLTYHYYDALLQARTLFNKPHHDATPTQDTDALRNLQLLLCELPSEHKPTVALVLHFLHSLLADAKDEAEREAWSEALADAFSHAFLRTYLPPTLVHQRGRLSRLLQCREEVEVMCLLIRHQPLLTAPLDADLQDLTTRLATKCSRLQHLRSLMDEEPLWCGWLVLDLARLVGGVDQALTSVHSVSASQPLAPEALLSLPSALLQQQHSRRRSKPSLSEPPLPSSPLPSPSSSWSGLEKPLELLLEAPAPALDPSLQALKDAGTAPPKDKLNEAVAVLKRCGLGPLERYTARGVGALGIDLIAYFLKRFPQPASLMLFKYGRQHSSGFSRLACAVANMVISLLRLQYRGPLLVVQACRSAGAWNVLCEEYGLHEVFSLAMVLLDFIAHHQPIRAQDDDAYVLEVKRQLTWVMRQTPQSSEEAWQLWLAVRLEKQRRFAEHRQRQEALIAAQHTLQQQRQTHAPSQPPTPTPDPPQPASSATSAAPAPEGVEKEDEEEEDEESSAVPIRVQRPSNLVSMPELQALEKALPPHYRGYRWELLYSLKEHGASLTTLFRRTGRREPSMLIVKDTQGAVFGGFATKAWRDSTVANRGGSIIKDAEYYGDGETFVWKLHNGTEGPVAVTYQWSGQNNYFMLSSHRGGLAFGGGGNFALLLDSELLQGSSGPCLTFDTPGPLASSESFECLDLEVWGFATAFGHLAT